MASQPPIGAPRGVRPSVWIIAAIAMIVIAAAAAALIPSAIGIFIPKITSWTAPGEVSRAVPQARQGALPTPIYPESEELVLQVGELTTFRIPRGYRICLGERPVGAPEYRPIDTPGLGVRTDARGKADARIRESAFQHILAEQTFELTYFAVLVPKKCP